MDFIFKVPWDGICWDLTEEEEKEEEEVPSMAVICRASCVEESSVQTNINSSL